MRRLWGLLRFGFTAWLRPGGTSGAWRAIIRSALALAALLAALLLVYLIAAGWLYPLRPDVIEHLTHPLSPTMPGAWGGPTLVGAWAVHVVVALLLQAGALGLIALCRAGSARTRRTTDHPADRR